MEEPLSLVRTLYHYEATVIKVIDGDTVDLSVDLGFYLDIEIRTRLLGINAPELRDEAGMIARDFLRVMLPVGTTVRVSTYKTPGDKYGRWLATIYQSGQTASVNQIMVAEGHAVVADY